MYSDVPSFRYVYTIASSKGSSPSYCCKTRLLASRYQTAPGSSARYVCPGFSMDGNHEEAITITKDEKSEMSILLMLILLAHYISSNVL